MTDATPYLHMDAQWMWRFYFLDRSGKSIAVSMQAYFTRDEAEVAMRDFQRLSFVIAA